MILHILYIASIRDYTIISPESIDTPPDIAISRSSNWIPPRVYLRYSRIGLSPDIMPAHSRTSIEPGSFQRMKPDLPIIGLWSSQIDRMMSTVDISTPEDTMPEGSERVHIGTKFPIEYELALPRLI
jgi:hypothetical protein